MVYLSGDRDLKIAKEKIDFELPFVVKPDIGGRGRKVAIIKSTIELEEYHNTVGEDYMIQEFIEAPLELGVFMTKLPSQANAIVTSAPMDVCAATLNPPTHRYGGGDDLYHCQCHCAPCVVPVSVCARVCVRARRCLCCECDRHRHD